MVQKINPLALEERYDVINDAIMRLDRVIVTYEGVDKTRVLFIEAIHEVDNVIAFDCLEGNLYSLNANDASLNVNQPPLGYCNYEGSAVYLVHPPSRSQRAGACLSHLVPLGPQGRTKHTNKLSKSWLPSIALTILNDYPKFSQVLTRKSGAFSRNYALFASKNGKSHSLLYKNTPIGMLLKDKKRFVVVDSLFDKSREAELVHLLHSQGEFYDIQRILG